MKTFSNKITTIIQNRYGRQIDIAVSEADTTEKAELHRIVSECIQELIDEEIACITDGAVSDIIHTFREDIQIDELIAYHLS